MAPYAPSSDRSDGSYTAAAQAKSPSDRESVIFSLTERLREREDKVRELEKQLLFQGNLKLDVAYEELLAHLKHREEDFRTESKRQDERLKEAERENRRLRDREGQHRALTATEKVMAQELEAVERRLDAALDESAEKDRRILALEGLVDRLDLEAGRRDEKGGHDKELLARLGDRVESYKISHRELEAANEELARVNEELGQRNEDLERRIGTQRCLLQEKEQEVLEAEQFRGQREDELTEDLDRQRRRYMEIVAAHKDALEDREEEIHLLYLQCERYEDIVDEAEYVTHEQRTMLQARKREIEKLHETIEKAQNSGLLSRLDRMCTGASSVAVSGNSLVEGGNDAHASKKKA